MESNTLFWILTFIGIFLVILILLYVRGSRQVKKMKELVLNEAIPAEAKIIKIERGSFSRMSGTQRKIEIILTLEIHHPKKEKYTAETRWLIDEIAIPQIQPDKMVKIKINAHHSERIYPNVEWAEFTDWKLDKNKI